MVGVLSLAMLSTYIVKAKNFSVVLGTYNVVLVCGIEVVLFSTHIPKGSVLTCQLPHSWDFYHPGFAQ